MIGFSEEDDEEGDEEEPGLSNPKRALNSSGGRKTASGLEIMGIEYAVGIRPVVDSSEGSRTSVVWGKQ